MPHKRYSRRFKYRRYSLISTIFYRTNRFFHRHRIISPLLCIIGSVILIRLALSEKLFGNSITEFRLWFIGFAVLIGIIGIISLKVWFRNNVADFNAQINLNWRAK